MSDSIIGICSECGGDVQAAHRPDVRVVERLSDVISRLSRWNHGEVIHMNGRGAARTSLIRRTLRGLRFGVDISGW